MKIDIYLQSQHCHGTDVGSSVGGSSQQLRNSRSSRESSILSTEDASSYKSRCTEEEEADVDEELGGNGSSSLSSGQSPPITGNTKQRAWAPSIFGTTKTSSFSTNAQSRFASVVFDGVLGPPHLARHTNDGVHVYL